MTKADFFALSVFNVHPVDVPGDRRVYVRELTARERSQYELSLANKEFDSCRERLLSLCVCDETGARIFNEQDIDEIGRLPAVFVEPIFNKAREVSGLDAKAEAEGPTR